jgi:methylmalonyl-CoA/ethylmalonyl-CoA epimerase
MGLEGLDHICIDVSNLTTAREFYVDKLGFAEYSPANVQGKMQTIFLKSGGVIVDLKCPLDGKVPPSPETAGYRPGINHIALKTDDIQQTYRELSARGVKFKSEPKFMAHSDRWIAIFYDPDGNCFHLTS